MKEKVDIDGTPSYIKNESVLMFLFAKNNSLWTISKSSEDILFQLEPNPAPSEDLPWFLKIEGRFVPATGIVLRPVYKLEYSDNQMMIIGISVSLTLLVLLIVGAVLLIKRRRKAKEEPKMEENDYYDCDDEYSNEYDNRIEDRH